MKTKTLGFFVAIMISISAFAAPKPTPAKPVDPDVAALVVNDIAKVSILLRAAKNLDAQIEALEKVQTLTQGDKERLSKSINVFVKSAHAEGAFYQAQKNVNEIENTTSESIEKISQNIRELMETYGRTCATEAETKFRIESAKTEKKDIDTQLAAIVAQDGPRRTILEKILTHQDGRDGIKTFIVDRLLEPSRDKETTSKQDLGDSIEAAYTYLDAQLKR